VDTFQGSAEEGMAKILAEHDEGWLRKTFENNIAGVSNITVLATDSLSAAKLMKDSGKQADMVFLDASHDYESVAADIRAWQAVLRPGGLLCGHDRGWEGVSRAIDTLLSPHEVGAGAIWYKIL
jgi:predicted O-methyltransferase YrrM